MIPREQQRTKICDLEQDLEIWKVHLDGLREQDKNARLMDKRRFARLTENIKKDSRLEYLPYCCFKEDRIEIISGHHRVRAARAAGITEIFCIVDNKTLTRSQIRAKQLAHNALVGTDDKTMLKQLWSEIEDLEDQLSTGILPDDLQETELKSISTEAISLDFTFKTIQFVFLPTSYEKVLSTFKSVAEVVGIADIKQYEPFVKILKKTSKTEDIRNIGAILVKICEIVNEYLQDKSGQLHV